MTDREWITGCKRWAEYLRPVIENDNAWYGQRWLDGKDAGDIGELLQAVAAIGDRLIPEIPDGVGSVHLVRFTEGWQATILHDNGDEQMGARRGVGPAAAIANALESDQ